MRVYVETNFILELVLQQEECDACEALVALAQSKQIMLVTTSFSFVEPYTTLRGRAAMRRRLSDDLTRELREIARTRGHAQAVASTTLPALLVQSANDAQQGLLALTMRLVPLVDVLPLAAPTLLEGDRLRRDFGLTYPDAIVLAGVLLDPRLGAEQSCFLNRNTKDFDDPTIVETLCTRRCKLLPGFAEGLKYIQNHLARGA